MLFIFHKQVEILVGVRDDHNDITIVAVSYTHLGRESIMELQLSNVEEADEDAEF